MKNNVFFAMAAIIMSAGFVLAGCTSTSSEKEQSGSSQPLTKIPSYYVRADGNDTNTGTSEDAPFKTLRKALELASQTTIKRITVIGTLVGETSTEGLDLASAKQITKIIDATSWTPEQGVLQLLSNQNGVAQLVGSYDDPNPYEILITGKPNATAVEKAVLTTDTGVALRILNAAIRLENIEISGCKAGIAIVVNKSDLTLAVGVKITRNIGNHGVGIYAVSSTLIMRNNAEISYNEGMNGHTGLFLSGGSVGILLDDVLIAHNKSALGGGGIALNGSTLVMKNNAKISNNSAATGGGGIVAMADNENGFISQITISDNASVINNSAREGGGVFLTGELILRDNARITGNTASETCGGVFVRTADDSVYKEKDVILANNYAPKTPDINMTF